MAKIYKTNKTGINIYTFFAQNRPKNIYVVSYQILR